MDILLPVDEKKIMKYVDTIYNEYKKYTNYKYVFEKIDYDFFSFPENEYKEIKENLERIKKCIQNNNSNELIVKEYNKLIDNINLFTSKIKKSSYENDIFSEINKINLELFNVVINISTVISSIHALKNDSDNENIIEEYEEDMNKNKLGFSNLLNPPSKDNVENPFENSNISGISRNEEGNVFINEIHKNNDIEKQLYKYKKFYMNLLVKNDYFNKLKIDNLKNIQNLSEECKEYLINFRKIRDEFIIKQCKISENKLDFNYNFIIPNINFVSRKGGEIYIPPEGWFGFGVKVINKYNKAGVNLKKAIAYYSFNNMTPRKIIMELNNIISNGLKLDDKLDKNYQTKCNCIDIRSRAKMKVGTGIYLSPKIDFIESNTGMIYFNGKAYKIALMVSVPADKIRQPDSNYWILRDEEIEINKIIFKEIHLDFKYDLKN